MTRDQFDQIMDAVAEAESDALFNRMNALMESRRPTFEEILPELTVETVKASVHAAGRLIAELGLVPLDG